MSCNAVQGVSLVVHQRPGTRSGRPSACRGWSRSSYPPRRRMRRVGVARRPRMVGREPGRAQERSARDPTRGSRRSQVWARRARHCPGRGHTECGRCPGERFDGPAPGVAGVRGRPPRPRIRAAEARTVTRVDKRDTLAGRARRGVVVVFGAALLLPAGCGADPSAVYRDSAVKALQGGLSECRTAELAGRLWLKGNSTHAFALVVVGDERRGGGGGRGLVRGAAATSSRGRRHPPADDGRPGRRGILGAVGAHRPGPQRRWEHPGCS